MRLLYWNPCLRDPYAAGTHAREVLAALERIPGLEVVPWPPAGQSSAARAANRPFGRFLPCWAVLARRMWLRPPSWMIPTLHGPSPDAILARPNSHHGLLRALKARYPNAVLCAEVNAMVADEIPAFLPLRSRWGQWEATAIRRAADRIVVVSSWLRDRLVALGLDPGRILVNPNGANVDHFNPERWLRNPELLASWGVPHDAFVFGYVGGMERFRRLPLLVTKFGEFASGFPDAYLILIGDGPEHDKVHAAIAALPEPLRQRIRQPGVVAYEQVPAAMACFDCGVFPFSNPYGSPQKIFEYLAMGLPVIGPDVPAVREVFIHKHQIALAMQDGSDLVDLLELQIASRIRNPKMALQARNLIRSQYQWDANASRLQAFLSIHPEVRSS